jgi:predicted TIM-barrel enzyme
MTQNRLAFDHTVIAALHLPDPVVQPGLSKAFLEDYVLTNAAVFAKAGIPAVKLQDQTRAVGPASAATIARTAALGRLIRSEFPDLALGIIVQAHDAESPIAIAEACGASFVRLKVYVGAVMSSEGQKSALCVAARAYRQAAGAEGVAILADVHDRTSFPVGDVKQPQAAKWAVDMGADGLVITGSDFDDSLARIKALRTAGIKAPVLVGGGVNASNIRRALAEAAGVVVSTSIMRLGAAPNDPLKWDLEKSQRLMQAAKE